MKEEILSASIDVDGEVVVLTAKACYHYPTKLSEEKAKWLLAKVAQAKEIDPENWKIEWQLNGVTLKKIGEE